MSRAALGAYLRALRDGQPLDANGEEMSRDALLRALPPDLRGTSSSNIGRIERGEHVPGSDVLAALLAVLGGDGQEALTLLHDPLATPEQARLLAARRLALEPAPHDIHQVLEEVAFIDREHKEASARPREIELLYRILRVLRNWSEGNSGDTSATSEHGG